MNSSIGIALLLLFASAQSVAGVKRNNPNVLEIREQINNLNKMRLEVAKKHEIANMHEVTWDQTLESKIKKMTCDELGSTGPDYLVFDSYEVDAALETKVDYMKSAPLHPLQTKIACGTLPTECDGKSDTCLMGPKNSPLKKSEIEKGSPGTGCSGGNGASGLCMGGGVSSASTPMAIVSLAFTLIMA
ncbi:hypothetical protein GCK72_003205 [Caenorhabditis remanei]|uniref:SCP domain-containing protein n=1 Tax=Caenorhabditis remanei TaxID=31234 RepID=A0A6A5HUE6_CAERE|nr:hypothetical protein GCK72_003205 [Caenorhabditis remanei]KAF1771379.1 hypothetical protein GCK72_003205 [Caenorhabditis remanei]